MSGETQRFIVQEIARCQPRLRAFVRCLLVNSSDVDDVLQEVNSVLWEKANGFQPGTDFWAWASQIARFKVLNQIRKSGSDRLVFDAEILERMALVAEQRLSQLDQRRDSLEHCLNKLPPAQRQLIDLRYVDGQAIERIAGSIGGRLVRFVRHCFAFAVRSSIASNRVWQWEVQSHDFRAVSKGTNETTIDRVD